MQAADAIPIPRKLWLVALLVAPLLSTAAVVGACFALDDGPWLAAPFPSALGTWVYASNRGASGGSAVGLSFLSAMAALVASLALLYALVLLFFDLDFSSFN